MSLTKIRTSIIFAVAFCLVAGLTVTALAGPGRGHGGPGAHRGGHGGHHGGHHGGEYGLPVERLARFLELSDEQVAAAKAIREAAEAQAEPLKEAHKALRQEMRTLLDAENPDATAIGEAAIELHEGRERSRAIRAQAKADFAALLTAEQLEKLETLKDARGHRKSRWDDGEKDDGEDA